MISELFLVNARNWVLTVPWDINVLTFNFFSLFLGK